MQKKYKYQYLYLKYSPWLQRVIHYNYYIIYNYIQGTKMSIFSHSKYFSIKKDNSTL